MANAATVLTRVADHCRSAGMSLVLENMLPHLLFGHTSDLLWMVGAITDLNVGVCLDTGHAHIAGDLYSSAQKLSKHLQMLHANDNDSRWDQHLPPGKGAIDWHRMVVQLVDESFRGGIIMELSGETGTDASRLLHQAQEARLYLHQVFRQVELNRTRASNGV
jgi:sugar phosphate isomerase/epimerase